MSYSGVGEDEAGKEGEAGGLTGSTRSLTRPADTAAGMNAADQT